MRVLVDTSIWSLALRRRRRSLNARQRRLEQELAQLIADGQVVLMGLVRQEVLSGIKDESTFDRLSEYLRHFDDETLTTEDYEEAARCHNRCRAAGVSGSAVDFLLCAAALRRDLAIFTTDADFQRYAKHLPLRLYEPRESGT